MAPGALMLEYYEVEEGSLGVACALAGPQPSGSKEPAGAAFHEMVLRQQGLLGERVVCASRGLLVLSCIRHP
jgi:hypothetical protein